MDENQSAEKVLQRKLKAVLFALVGVIVAIPGILDGWQSVRRMGTMSVSEFIVALSPWCLLVWGICVPLVVCAFARARFEDLADTKIGYRIDQLNADRESDKTSLQAYRDAMEEDRAKWQSLAEQLQDTVAAQQGLIQAYLQESVEPQEADE